MTNNTKALFPIFVDLSDKRAVIIGAGKIATRRTKILAEFMKDIMVIAPFIEEELKSLADAGAIRLISREFVERDIDGADIVIAATDDAELNRRIYDLCHDVGIMVNVISDRTLCDFHFPGIVKRDNLVVGVNAGGEGHSLAKTVREKIDKLL